MVSPASTKRSIRRRQRRNGSTDILVVIGVVAVAVSFAWLVAITLIRRQESPTNKELQNKKSFDASEESMIATKRPYIIYGTAWKKDDTASLVFQAINAGFRFVDTACQPKHYNEAGVGSGIQTAITSLGLSREDIKIQTKFTSMDVSYIRCFLYRVFCFGNVPCECEWICLIHIHLLHLTFYN